MFVVRTDFFCFEFYTVVLKFVGLYLKFGLFGYILSWRSYMD